MRRALVVFYFIVFTSLFSAAQTLFPEAGPVFNDGVVPRIDITIHPDTLSRIMANPLSDIEYHATFMFTSGMITEKIENVGFRLRGNTSRYSKKKSFKVSFNTYTKGGKFYGLEKLNLNGEHNDPSVMRSKIMWDILRKWGIPSPRANHVALYINSNYHGLYLNVEHIDEQFVKTRYGNNDGNLYKCLWPADLNYLGPDQNSYKLMAGDRRVYDLKINEEVDDYSDLVKLIDGINNSSDDGLVCRLNSYFNSYDYLKIIVADILCGNWDGYIYNKNNFYLYKNTATGKFEYIPYDVDNTFGIDWFNVDWSTRNIYSWSPGSGQYRPLYDRLMNHPEYRSQFSFYTRELLSLLNIDSLAQKAEARRVMLAPYIASDSYYPLDYGFSYNDFILSLNNARGGHVKSGIKPFLIARKASMLEQAELNPMLPVINHITYEKLGGQKILIRAKVDIDIYPATVSVRYLTDMWNEKTEQMGLSDNGFYETVIHNVTLTSDIRYQIIATSGIGLTNTQPCIPAVIEKTDYDSNLGNSFYPYPNPVSGDILYLSRIINCRVVNLNGVVVLEGKQVSTIETGNLPPGIYTIISEDGTYAKFIKL